MKKLWVFVLLGLFLWFLSACAVVEAPPPDYPALLAEAAGCADAEAGRAAARLRNAALGPGEAAIDFDELLLLARALTAAAGDPWRTEELRQCVGEVLLNRVASPEFPDTLPEVLAGAEDAGFPAPEALEAIRPSPACVQSALALLQGRRLLDERVVYLSDREMGGGIYATFCDRRLRSTCFCLSAHPELYPEPSEGAISVDGRAGSA